MIITSQNITVTVCCSRRRPLWCSNQIDLRECLSRWPRHRCWLVAPEPHGLRAVATPIISHRSRNSRNSFHHRRVHPPSAAAAAAAAGSAWAAVQLQQAGCHHPVQLVRHHHLDHPADQPVPAIAAAQQR